MATLKYGNTIIENVAIVKIDDTVNKDIIVEYTGEGFHNSFKIEKPESIRVLANGFIGITSSISDVTVFGNVHRVDSRNTIKVQGRIDKFEHNQPNIIVSKSVKVTAKKPKKNIIEISGRLQSLEVKAFFLKCENKIDVEIHGECCDILVDNMCKVKGNVEHASAMTSISCSMH